jgi:ribonuclease HII
MRTRSTGARSTDTQTPPLWHATASTDRSRVLAGVDEAGLGPLLGPLTIGYSAFRVPPGTSDLWHALADVVDAEPRKLDPKLLVADSKVVFMRNARGARRLERTALAFLAQADPSRAHATDGASLLKRTTQTAERHDALESEAWFPHLPETLPRAVERDALASDVASLGVALSRANVSLCSAGVRVLPVSDLNASFARTENKSLTHWETSAVVLRYLWEKYAHESLDVLVDRHGGRMRYARLLRDTFPECSVDVVSELPARSEYELFGHAMDGGIAPSMRIAFAERAESASFAVALSSCLAKYVRETCMHAFNAYFASLQPGLKPTAGYTTDGRRWIDDAQTAIARSGIKREALVRGR